VDRVRSTEGFIGYVGVIGVQEGLHHLIRAAASMVHNCRRTDIHFVIIGSDGAGVRRLAQHLRNGWFPGLHPSQGRGIFEKAFLVSLREFWGFARIVRPAYLGAGALPRGFATAGSV
jgi:hypothetical protein